MGMRLPVILMLRQELRCLPSYKFCMRPWIRAAVAAGASGEVMLTMLAPVAKDNLLNMYSENGMG